LRILHFLGIGHVPKKPMFTAMGGTERVALEIAKRQVINGHDVTVASMSTTSWSGTWEGVHCLHLKPYRWAKIRYRGRNRNLEIHLPLAVLIWFGRFDIIHLHEYIVTRLFPPTLIVMHFHNDPLGGFSSAEFADYVPRYWKQLGKSAAQIAVSEFVATRLRLVHQTAGATALPANIITDQSGVDLSLFAGQKMAEDRTKIRKQLGLRESDVLFTFAGALRPAKGGDVLARAFKRLLEESSNAYLAIAGGSDLWINQTEEINRKTKLLEEDVRDVLKDAIGQKRAFLLGLIPPRDLPAIYAAADVFVLPTSVQEGFGLVVLESFAAVRPVIATRSGGVPELVKDGKSGLLVSRGDDKELYHAMRKMLLDKELRERFGREGERTASTMSWENTVQRLEVIYADIMAKRKSKVYSRMKTLFRR
jgi:glycosyltransferase involved in cell wall biosynthesis